jgi:hypothetical protein
MYISISLVYFEVLSLVAVHSNSIRTLALSNNEKGDNDELEREEEETSKLSLME